LKRSLTISGIILSLVLPTSSKACSLVSCSSKNSEEMGSDFVVKITLRGKPLANVNTWVTRFPGEENKLFSGLTGNDGTVRIHDLQPGEYWLASELLGIGAGGICFHVNTRPSRRAKQMVAYEWGEEAASTRQVAGKLIDPRPGEGAAFLQNVIHHVVVPIPSARFTLHDPLTDAIYSAVSDDEGRFSLGEIPNGTYVLHIEGGVTPVGHELQPTDLLIRVIDTASQETLLLERSPGSTCGGPYITVDWPEKNL